jgi:putative endopeptidase
MLGFNYSEKSKPAMTPRVLIVLTLLLLMPGAARAAAPQVPRGFDPANMDTSASPCADFFQYAVGGWVRRTTIPAEYGKYGVDQEVNERTFAIVKDILEAAAADTAAPQGSARRKVGEFFAAGMDEARIESEGARPIAPLLRRIAAVRDRRALAAVIAGLQEAGGPVFRLEVGPDDRNSARNIAQMLQAGLGLPDREYYLKQDPESVRLRQAYGAHVARMFRLLGDTAPAAERAARIVMRMETRLAQASMPRDEVDDPSATYHRMTQEALAGQAPGFAWTTYFRAAGLDDRQPVLVRQPAFFRELGRMAQKVPLADWRAYLRWHLVRATAPYLSTPFEQEAFAFNGTTLQGIRALPPRWKRVLGETDAALGEGLGRLYVERAFSPRAKQKALEMAENIRAAFRARLLRLEWMGEATKAQALTKLDAMRVKIGYPDAWRDYASLKIDRTSYAGNVIAARRFEFRRGLAKAGGPVDPGEWSMTPITNNAYYEQTMNELVFPAGILQPPFFDPEADDAENYGLIGATIGHELTHGFDDVGRQYDAQGNLRDWWTAADEQAFSERTAVLVKQYDRFEPLPGLRVNGTLTLGENLADLGGLAVAYDAFTRLRQDRPGAVARDGFTPEQRFFLSYAETWRFTMREELLRARLLTDEHAPSAYRVLGPLSNLPEFAAAFACRPGDPMVRPAGERVSVW